MSLRVVKAGLAASLQDMGRRGHLDKGVPPSGALDPLMLKIANRLAGNPLEMAGVELIGPGTLLEAVGREVRIALAGEMAARIDGEVKPSWRSHTLKPGQRLELGAPAETRACYLAVAGGFAAAAQLGSRSTLAKAGLGTALQEGMELPLDAPHSSDEPERIFAKAFPGGGGVLRVVAGPEDDAFDAFVQAEWTVSAQSDRMGLRLSGPKLARESGGDIPTGGILMGCVQLPGSGQPILMLADHQTTGGYARVACVIAADLARAGRLVPGRSLRFQPVTWREARAALLEERRRETDLLAAVRPLLAGGSEDLLAANLVSGMVGAMDWDEDA